MALRPQERLEKHRIVKCLIGREQNSRSTSSRTMPFLVKERSNLPYFLSLDVFPRYSRRGPKRPLSVAFSRICQPADCRPLF